MTKVTSGRRGNFFELGVRLETPLKSNMNDTRPFHFVKMMNKTRRKVETVIGQLSERFNIETDTGKRYVALVLTSVEENPRSYGMRFCEQKDWERMAGLCQLGLRWLKNPHTG